MRYLIIAKVILGNVKKMDKKRDPISQLHGHPPKDFQRFSKQFNLKFVDEVNRNFFTN